jgi:anti-sigma B factor antagonist
MSAALTTRQAGDVSVVYVSGRVTLGGGSNALGVMLRDLVSSDHKKILVNLGGVSYIDSSGIGELVSAFTALTQAGGQLKLLGLSTRIKHILLITRNYSFFDVHDDEAAATRSFELA